jgi:hypothetical protein
MMPTEPAEEPTIRLASQYAPRFKPTIRGQKITGNYNDPVHT